MWLLLFRTSGRVFIFIQDSTFEFLKCNRLTSLFMIAGPIIQTSLAFSKFAVPTSIDTVLGSPWGM